jgi:hypothetical protein
VTISYGIPGEHCGKRTVDWYEAGLDEIRTRSRGNCRGDGTFGKIRKEKVIVHLDTTDAGYIHELYEVSPRKSQARARRAQSRDRWNLVCWLLPGIQRV